jgi:hypothetical protein
MPAPKKPDASPEKTAAPDLPKVSDRKPWKKKTPVEIVLEQADKLREEIAEDEAALNAKRRQLEKFEQAKKLFDGV